jgi:hypothetical protein
LGVLTIPDQPTLISGQVLRFREAAGATARPGQIELHIIQPGWGSSGYYGEAKLRKACEVGVYPKGMLMHMDHPTAKQEKDNPARSTETLAAVLAEAGHYETDGWDKTPENPTGAGVYSVADVRPHRREDLKWLSGKIGVSHYVDGIAEDGEAPDGKTGRIITELRASPFNSVDFVTIPGAGGHSRSIAEVLKESQETNQRKKMADNQESLTLSEVRTKHPEIITELKEQLVKELKIESITESQKIKLTEAETRIKTLEAEVDDMAQLAAKCEAAGYIKAEVDKAEIPPSVGESLRKSLLTRIKLGEDHKIDTVGFGLIVAEAIKEKKAEVAAILKESGRSGIHDNGGSFTAGTEAEVKKAREDLRDSYVASGMNIEQAKRLAGIEA